jgi:prevent-host-death family protein
MSAPTAVFSDEIFTATDLNRRAGHVLDEARTRPVTITRNDEAFALLNRQEASRMVEATSNARLMVDLVTAISTYRLGDAPVPIGHTFEWLNAFDIEELRTLLAEVHLSFRRAADAETSWDDFEALLHEWHESAIAIRSDRLAAAFSEPGQEVPLTQPALTATDSSINA